MIAKLPDYIKEIYKLFGHRICPIYICHVLYTAAFQIILSNTSEYLRQEFVQEEDLQTCVASGEHENICGEKRGWEFYCTLLHHSNYR